jgi:light-regulated signal transduction histidine kinase (bacteriophytochrome)
MKKAKLIIGQIKTLINDNKSLIKENKFLKNEISQKVKIEAYLSRENEELENFAIMVCHEINQPLAGTANFIRLLKKKYKDKLNNEAILFINKALTGLETTDGMIKALLDFSRFPLEANKLKVGKAKNSIIPEIISSLSELIEKTGAEITYDKLPETESNSIQMTQVLMNLICNAIKYRRTGENPKIHVSVKKKKNFWLFSVTDNGIGISKKYFDDIFRIFNRVGTREVHVGYGIGLTIAKKIIEGNKGKIWLESEVGKGSTFFFTIPVQVKA